MFEEEYLCKSALLQRTDAGACRNAAAASSARTNPFPAVEPRTCKRVLKVAGRGELCSLLSQ
jgi:hypothetical protein